MEAEFWQQQSSRRIGLISNGQSNESPGKAAVNKQLAAFWAPFLLLHLGGPDAITAFSLEDNELHVNQASLGGRHYDDTAASTSLPRTLMKLDLRSVPFYRVPQWMEPRQLPHLEKLYIKGGKLNNLNNRDQYVNVKFVRLNYLKKLKINQEDLVALFPNYQYLQRTN